MTDDLRALQPFDPDRAAGSEHGFDVADIGVLGGGTGEVCTVHGERPVEGGMHAFDEVEHGRHDALADDLAPGEYRVLGPAEIAAIFAGEAP